MASIAGVFTAREVKGLDMKQRRKLKSYHIRNLSSSGKISKLAKKDPKLSLQIGKVRKKQASLRALVKKRRKIQKILKVAASPMLAQMKKKKMKKK